MGKPTWKTSPPAQSPGALSPQLSSASEREAGPRGSVWTQKSVLQFQLHGREDEDARSAEWTSVGEQMRERGTRKELVSSLAHGPCSRGQRKSGPRLQLDIRLTVDKYCLLSLRHWSSIDRVKILFVAGMEKLPNSHRGFKKNQKKMAIFFLALWVCFMFKLLEIERLWCKWKVRETTRFRLIND